MENFWDGKVQPKYKGEIKNRKPNGKGKNNYPNGFEYLSNYNDGQLKIRWKKFKFHNGRIYLSEFKDGKIH